MHDKKDFIRQYLPNTIEDIHIVQIDLDITGLTLCDILRNINITFPYYAKPGYITPIDPFIWHNNADAKYNYHEELSNGVIDKYAYDLSNVKDCILYTDDIENAPTNKRSVKELKDMLGNHSVYVKTANGTKNYSTVKNLLETVKCLSI